jgi:hypothetical protein
LVIGWTIEICPPVGELAFDSSSKCSLQKQIQRVQLVYPTQAAYECVKRTKVTSYCTTGPLWPFPFVSPNPSPRIHGIWPPPHGCGPPGEARARSKMFHSWRVAPLAPVGGLRPGHIRVLWADKLVQLAGWHSIVVIVFPECRPVESGTSEPSCQYTGRVEWGD